MAQSAPPSNGPPSTLTTTNGLVTASSPRGVVGGNRKKAKRRAKQQAKQAAQLPSPEEQHDEPQYDVPGAFDPHDDYYSDDDDDVQYTATASHHAHATNGAPHNHEHHHHHHHHPHHHHYPDDMSHAAAGSASGAGASTGKKKNKKKRRSTSAQQTDSHPGQMPDPTSLISSAMNHMPLPTPPPPPMAGAAFRPAPRNSKQDRIWNTSTQEERERIKEFWLSLSEEERKSLLKIEKEAVLRKMKEQQKHSCSCTVCGRKRTAIEEELEVLYDAYYEELESYANHQGGEPGDGILPPPRAPIGHLHRNPAMPLPLNAGSNPQHRTSRVHEIIDDDDEQDLSDEEDDDEDDYDPEDQEEDEEYSDEEDEEYSDEEDEPDDDLPRGIGADFFNFGNSLTVKGGILTVADDLLKNDGKKFIEMMEQLAERRMQREHEAEYAASQPAHSYAVNGHEPPMDEDDYDDDEEEYDSQEEYDDDEEEVDEMGGMTEEQRMEEGRRMFQIFAARMFEQRVLTAYREKVAAERQAKLLEELEDETKLNAEKEAKKARDAEKRKKKKEAQKQAKAEEKAKKEAEKAAEEAAQRAIEEKKQEEQRRRKEEQRRKKEAERKAQEEERQRKEAERLKRQQEERERQQESERKLREQKAQEKKQREEARKKEREEREAKEKEAKEKRAQDERERREREAKAKADKDASTREKLHQQHTIHPPQIAKRPSQAGLVAVPPGLHPTNSSSGHPSPHISVATPALPKAPTPARQMSHHSSHATSPKSSLPATSKSTSPSSAFGPQTQTAPKTILQKPQTQAAAMHHPQPTSPGAPLPPPGMHPQQHGSSFAPFPPMGGYGGYHPPNAQFMGRQSFQSFPSPQAMGMPFQPFHGPNGVSNGPPGMAGFGLGRGFSVDTPPGFQQPQQMPPLGPTHAAPGFGVNRPTMSAHSRQHSTDKAGIDGAGQALPSQPISRPAPIQRPSSVKPQELTPGAAEIDDLSKHLGSSALLDDADDPIPIVSEARRQSTIGGPRSGPIGFSSPFSANARMEPFGPAGGSWSQPGMFGSGPLGPPVSSSWGANISTASAWASGFAPLGGHRPSVANRPLQIRIALCNACKQLAVREPSSDGYHPIDILLREMQASRPPIEFPLQLKEIQDICETEGDPHNGGGTLHVRPEGSSFSVRLEQDAGTPSAGRPPAELGEIGSPMPGHSVPAFGAGQSRLSAGFQSLGGVISGPATNLP